MICPAETLSVPASKASNVDLPAPLGPMSPVRVPRRTASDTPETAWTPPKSRLTSMACRTTSCPAAGPIGTAGSVDIAEAAELTGPSLVIGTGPALVIGTGPALVIGSVAPVGATLVAAAGASPARAVLPGKEIT